MKKQIISEEFKKMQKLAGLITESQIDEISSVITEGEQWIEGNWNSENYSKLLAKIEEIFADNGTGASFSYNGKDFTIVKKGERYKISSGTDFAYEALDVKGAITAAHKFSNNQLPKTGLLDIDSIVNEALAKFRKK